MKYILAWGMVSLAIGVAWFVTILWRDKDICLDPTAGDPRD